MEEVARVPHVAPGPAPGDRSAGRLGHVQALRAFAALAVVADHLCLRSQDLLHRPLWSGSLEWGASGVDVFFVLSGFIIFTVHRSDISTRKQAKPYLIKRAIRIYPIYWVVTAIAFPIYLAGYGTDTKRSFMVILRSVTLFPQNPGVFPIVNVGWTLSYEVFFYLMFCLLIALTFRLAAAVWAAWLAPCLVIMVLNISGVWHPPNTNLYLFLFSERNLEFVLGGLVAYLVSRVRVPGPAVLLYAGLAWIVAIGFATRLIHGFSLVQDDPVVLVGLPSAIMLAGAATLDRAGRRPPSPVVRLGDASYSVYLIHFGVITAVFLAFRHLYIGGAAPFYAAVVVATLASVFASLILYRFVESPLLVWGRRRFLGSGPARPAPSGVRSS